MSDSYKRQLIKLVVFLACMPVCTIAQSKKNTANLVYVDKTGVMRYTKTGEEAAFFGVNYTVPFAYGYRSVKRTGIDIEKEIDEDVYHMARLGFDAFRVHVWDTEITDTAGNLLLNDHLRLFDYLVSKLKERNIKISITPIAFWGNGYPEKDERTPGFSTKYGKGQAVVNEEAIAAQENYLKQLFTHVNPYTKLTYTADPDIIVTELNNEPHHSGPKEKTTEYINRLAAAVRSTGWTKPVFYNISESPDYADAVVKANVDGHSFQWYPDGLVANRTLHGNFLPNVDRYVIPFDTLPAFKNRAKMVYEFDAADLLQSNMYPAMARSFRGASMQWATQFAYDPMATAYANTEYQTHYLNLVYTPSKAISLMIAGKAFHKLPRLRSYGVYPKDSVFDVFRVSYAQQLSEMNAPGEFYYSNTTATVPLNSSALQHIAGVGSSPVINYNGLGAYFLDKIEDGVWRLEVMPDAIHIKDPFEKASPKKEVTSIEWKILTMKITLPDIGFDFTITGLNEGNDISSASTSGSFPIAPGTYLIKSKTKSSYSIIPDTKIGTIGLREYVAPAQTHHDLYIVHTPFYEVSAGRPFTIAAKITGAGINDKASVELRNTAGKWKTIQMNSESPYDFVANVPADVVTPGLISYRIIFQKANNDFVVFPGNHKGDPYAWDSFENETWQTYVAPANSPVSLFNANTDRDNLEVYNPSWRDNTIQYITGETPGQLILKATMSAKSAGQSFGWQQYVADKLQGRISEIASLTKLLVKAKTSDAQPVKLKINLVTKNGASFATYISVNSTVENFNIPLNSFARDSFMLLPRPYPGFQPLMFFSSATEGFNVKDLDKIQVLIVPEILPGNLASKSVEIESIMLQ